MKRPILHRFGLERIPGHRSSHQILYDDHDGNHAPKETNNPQEDVLSGLMFLLLLLFRHCVLQEKMTVTSRDKHDSLSAEEVNWKVF
jgi:hypothetical protein